MTKINDIYLDLDQNIDIQNIYKNKNIYIDQLKNKSTNDIINKLVDIDLLWKKHPSINTNKSPYIDWLSNKKNNKIKLIHKYYFIEKAKIILLYLKNIFKYNKKNWFNYKNKMSIWFIIFLFTITILYIDKLFIEKYIKSWYNNIISIKNNSSDIINTKRKINDAKFDFIVSDILYTPFKIIPNQNIENWYHLIKWWKNVTELLNKWIEIYSNSIKFIEKSWWIHNIKLTNLLSNIQNDIEDLTSLLYIIITDYNKIISISDLSLNNKLSSTKIKLKDIYKSLDVINKDYDVFLNLLWHKKEKKYLILFQNNDEIRPTWWFIWSLALTTIKNWKVIDFQKDDVYAYEWEINKIYKEKDSAPKWLDKITDTFWLRDANYYVDFVKSSDSINYFLKKIDKNIDWLIYINQNTFLDFLKISWWMNFKQLWENITEKNFSLIISTLVEAQSFKVWALWTPKKILFDFANDFINIVKKDKNYYEYANILYKNIKSRDLVFYSFNPEENNLLWKLWFNGNINYSDSLDFTYPVFTSIWWNKSDRYIDIEYTKNIIKNNDCSIDTKLVINRTHTFTKHEEEKVNNLLNKYPIKDKTRKDIINIQWKWTNKVYTRILLPKEAIIKPKNWMTINKYLSVNVLEFYINTRPLESTNYTIEYSLKNSECKKYSYKLYKQPWIRKYNININDWNKIIKNHMYINDFNYR